MKSYCLLLGTGLSAFLVASAMGEDLSNKVVVTFDVPPVPRYAISFLPIYYEQGMQFYQNSMYLFMRQGPLLSDSPQNGTTIMIWDRPMAPIVFNQTSDYTFGLYSVDLAEANRTVMPGEWSALQPAIVSIRGYKADGTVLDTTFTTDGWCDGVGSGKDFETFYFDERFASDLVKAEFIHPSSTSGDYAADNVVFFNVVPEPGTVALLTLGGLILAARWWRRA